MESMLLYSNFVCLVTVSSYLATVHTIYQYHLETKYELSHHSITSSYLSYTYMLLTQILGFLGPIFIPLKLRLFLLLFLLFFRQLCQPKYFERYLPHLHFLRTLRNAVAAMVPVDVLKGFMSTVANSTVDLIFFSLTSPSSSSPVSPRRDRTEYKESSTVPV